MAFYPDRLKYVADIRGLSNNEIASLGGIALKRLQLVLDGDLIPSIPQIKKLSENMAVPYYAFFSKTYKIKEPKIIDFRNNDPKEFKLGIHAKAIKRNLAIRDFYSELYQRLDIAAPEKLTSIDIEENPEQLAQSIRYKLGIDAFQSTSDTKKDFYRKLRSKIEKLGIFVTQDHNISNDIDGFALFHETFTANYIFINGSKRNSGRKSFTLAHELAHILGKRSAISDDYKANNDVEQYCNQFAASLLIPRNKLLDFVESRGLELSNYKEARAAAIVISEYFKTSVSVALVRLKQVNLTNENHYFEFAKTFGEETHLDSVKTSQGGGSKEGPDQGVMAISKLGERAATLIAEALTNNVTSPIEVCERVGLSKKRVDGILRLVEERGLKL